ncbi:MAG TPA: RagB/SusD family nutrient uptake outer membrane protein [Bacteroidales bacterium]|mgnify:FL=1|nr:RagB/SusD family nutrient uptake outer membrane protein [Bacteroidales bacterium]
MKTHYKFFILLLTILPFTGCDKQILDLESLTEPVDATFFSNEKELELALTGTYNSLIRMNYGVAYQLAIDNGGSDIGISRGCEFDELGAGTHSAQSGTYSSLYSFYYRGIARANNLIQNMERSKDVVSEERFNQIKAQALVLRAYFYHYLIEFFGDVPYIEAVVTKPEDGLIPRTAKTEVVTKLLADLQTAAASLPLTWAEKGRITKGVALGLRARIALYNGLYTEAASSAKAVMDIEQGSGYSLYTNYQNLFQRAGEASPEIMLAMPFKDGFQTTTGYALGSRNAGSYTVMAPTQSMVDSYEASDGLPIDESTVYNPSKPFENRDPRLKASIITPQSAWAGFIFESHPDSVTFRLVNGTLAGSNKDCRKASWPAAFCGYAWKKYNDEAAQKDKVLWSEIDFSLMRYAEILLTYAEARIESGTIDESVLTAINRVRARAYGVNVADIGNYPEITTTDQAELRKIIRRERKVELANEGFRLFDIRRWRIAEKVMPVKIYGRILNEKTATLIPPIDDDGFVSYESVQSQYDLNTDARFPNAQNRLFNKNRDYLCPIPQAEIDTYAGFGVVLEQNPNY